MRNAIRNSIAAALAASIAIAGVAPANAQNTLEGSDNASAVAVEKANPNAEHRGNGEQVDLKADQDGDGIPDAWEANGVILMDGTELPLPAYGVDVDRPDLFLQLNWMASEYKSLGCDEAPRKECDSASQREYAPSAESLDEMVDLFDAHGVNLHIDAGDVYTNIPNYETHGGETVDYAKYYFENDVPAYKMLDNLDEYLGERQNIFRIGVIGDQIEVGNYASGISLVGDNSFFIANHRLMNTDAKLRNTILHEFGHTLGLRHYGAKEVLGGVSNSQAMDAAYQSVMNYQYQFSHFNYSEHPYVLDGPEGPINVPADWDMLKIGNHRIGYEALQIADFGNMRGQVPERFRQMKQVELVEAVKPDAEQEAAVAEAENKPEVEDNAKEAEAQVVKEAAKDVIKDAAQDAAEDKVVDKAPEKADKADKAQPVQQVQQQAPAKQVKQAAAADVNIMAIIAPIVALAAIIGIGFAVSSM